MALQLCSSITYKLFRLVPLCVEFWSYRSNLTLKYPIHIHHMV
nr:MAG: hypothetical protein H1Rhizo271509_000002 [Mitovirus sp.]